MKKLWNSTGSKLNPLIEAYTVGEDYLLDRVIMPYDILASRAHAKGLKQIGILKEEELTGILNMLDQLQTDFEAGGVPINIEDEDCHTVIEKYLTDKLGDTGKKIHTGRSRNDQILVAMRLFEKDQLNKLKEAVLDLAELFLKLADKYKEVPLPGYSHTRQAMLSSVGHYYCSLAESLLDDAELLAAIIRHIDKNPLGSAAGFGVSLPLDRHFTAKELGFNNIQINSLYCQCSRGKFESLYLEGLSQVMFTLGRFAADVIFFTSQECAYFTVADDLVTGSSIMPQKKNPDGLEILRGNVSIVKNNHRLVQDIFANLLSGYNRDLQLIKKPVIVSTDIVLQSIDVATLYLQGITPDTEKITSKISSGIFMADIANAMVTEKGIPFREAYEVVKQMGVEGININVVENLNSKKSLGSPGNLGIDILQERFNRLKKGE